jgi:transposase
MIVDRGRIAALLATGMTVREVAEEIGISKSVVHRMTGRAGLVAALAAGFRRRGWRSLRRSPDRHTTTGVSTSEGALAPHQ